MSSSSSDSDSDDLEPIRRIKINIKPKDAVKSSGADIEAIKASVEAWRPLGPRPHQSLTRRQSSLSSVSSLSFGTGSIQGGSGSTTATSSTGFNYSPHGGTGLATAPVKASNPTRGNFHINSDHIGNTFMRSSPSCSSLVNDFNNRTSFSNFMSNVSRTSSPLTFVNNYGDTVPIALAIQESIELTVKGQQGGHDQSEIKFDTRALGNIKVAFPNAYARSCSNGYKPSSVLKLRLHSTENILRYYASGLIRDLDSENSSLTESISTDGLENDGGSANGDTLMQDRNSDLFDMNESPSKTKGSTKIIEFDMDALKNQLKQQYDQSPNGRYYNVDALRYQIAPVDQFERCPIQVCAYWRVEPKLIKLRIDFKHSNQSGFNLERLREIMFNADLSNLIPANLTIEPVSPDAFATLRPSKIYNNNLSAFKNHPLSVSSNDNDSARQQAAPVMQHSNHQYRNLINVSDTPNHGMQSTQVQESFKQPASIQIRLPPPPSSRSHARGQNTLSRKHLSSSSSTSSTGSNSSSRQQYAPLEQPHQQATQNSYLDGDLLTTQDAAHTRNHDIYATTAVASLKQQMPLTSTMSANNSSSSTTTQNQSMPNTQPQAPAVPYITYEPQAHWNKQTKQLTWKFDNLLSYYKTDGYGSLLAKLDFRASPDAGPPYEQQPQATPTPVEVKFVVVDATISKMSMSVDSTGYRMSLLKKEVRSGRYKSEPHIS